ncbi:flagellar motor switch protein FliN [Salmonella enterica subsp. enterica serovar Dublin]|nr:flagellar motor switch protein FliN [Salmonella enterica]EGJ4783793.1 flagellar motor switch protein FliN [Salmonella enterica subsp. enterica serovar Dublin]EGS9782428.1 flagellar motor switch protein FliN [Salmonella enterica subsp. enterica serovar Dublin]EHD8199812.1 flagellar motor switch protein FliN [Salmonella enterica]
MSDMNNPSDENTGALDDLWADALNEQKATTNKSAADAVFQQLGGGDVSGAMQDIDLIMDIPVKLTVELGRTRMTIKELLRLTQGSVVALDGLAGEPLDILINGYLIAQGEVVVVADKYGVRITDIITPAGSPLMQVSGALIGIIALILAAAWVIKRMGFAPKGNSVRGLKVSASASLGPRERVVIVEVENARLVLGVTASQINLLHTLPPAENDTEAPVAPPADFQNMMKSLLKRSGRS